LLAETPVTLPEHLLQGRSVELQKVNQPARQVRIAGGAGQGDALQQPQGGGSRLPVVLAHPAVDAEQGEGQSPFVQADGDQMGERALRLGAAEEMKMAVFAIATMAVVEAPGTAAGIHQVAWRVVLLPQRRVSGGEGPHQGSLALNQAQPVMKGLLSRSSAGLGVLHQREGPHPPSWAPQPSDFALGEGEGFGAEVLGGVAA
jgi:hypothetical protein